MDARKSHVQFGRRHWKTPECASILVHYERISVIDEYLPGTESPLVDIVFRSCLNTPLLQSKDGFICRFASEIRIRAETFPVATALCDATHVHHWAEGNVDPFCFEFLA